MKYMRLLIGFFFLLSAGCDEVLDFYLGIPLQPVIDEDSFVPGLNIFGIVRPDSTGIYNNSFIMLQKVIPAVGASDSLDIGTAIVLVEKLSGVPSWYDFLHTDHNRVFNQKVYRPGQDFRPKSGDIFSVECAYPELPILTATTVVPNPPFILMNTLAGSDNSLSFEIQSDTTIFMYDIYVYAKGGVTGYQRLPGEQSANTIVFFPSMQGVADSIDVYSYAYNMARHDLR